MTPSSPNRQRRSRLIVTAFLVAIVAFSILASVLIIRGTQDPERQERYRELRESVDRNPQDRPQSPDLRPETTPVAPQTPPN